jgi:hypothetical protein
MAGWTFDDVQFEPLGQIVTPALGQARLPMHGTPKLLP